MNLCMYLNDFFSLEELGLINFILVQDLNNFSFIRRRGAEIYSR